MGTDPDARTDRLEVHNASVDESIAATGRCATVHLPTGRICTLDQSHEGSCDFTPAGHAHDATPT